MLPSLFHCRELWCLKEVDDKAQIWASVAPVLLLFGLADEDHLAACLCVGNTTTRHHVASIVTSRLTDYCTKMILHINMLLI